MTLPYLPPPEPWMAHALCPVQHECAEHAIENDEPAGLWGGLTPQRRRQIRRERGMG